MDYRNVLVLDKRGVNKVHATLDALRSELVAGHQTDDASIIGALDEALNCFEVKRLPLSVTGDDQKNWQMLDSDAYA